MSLTIDDLVVLGRAVPGRLGDGRTTVCLGGFSPSIGFVRIYPIRLRMKIRRWDIISVEVEQNAQDNRPESWKIVGSNEEWENLYEKIDVVGRIDSQRDRSALITSNITDCVADLNNNRLSLGFIYPDIKKLYFGENPQYGKPLQLALFTKEAEEWASIKNHFPLEPRIRYSCQNCKTKQGYHDQKVLEWGFYEWMRKNPKNIEQVWENASFHSDTHENYLFVGNQAHQRTSYLIISTLPIQIDPIEPS